MPTEREARLAFNETLFRTANERAAGWEERHAEDDAEHYQCECARLDCREKIQLLKAEYERVRQDPAHFVIVPGHQITDVESVVEEHEKWAVVEKNPGTRPIVEATDERSP